MTLIPTLYPEEEAAQILESIGKGYDNSHYLCPNTTSYSMLNEDAGIALAIEIYDDTDQHTIDVVMDTQVWVDYVTEHFTVEKYTKEEKLTWVALEKDTYTLDIK